MSDLIFPTVFMNAEPQRSCSTASRRELTALARIAVLVFAGPVIGLSFVLTFPLVITAYAAWRGLKNMGIADFG